MGVPLGHRNHYDRKDPIIPVERITKAAVDDIILNGNYYCLFKRLKNAKFRPQEYGKDELSQILHDGKTKVKVAGSRTPGYVWDRDTIVMEAPCVKGTILLRVSRYAIEKTYTFEALTSGSTEDVKMDVQLDHDEAMELGKLFLNEDPCEIAPESYFKDQLDDVLVEELAKTFRRDYDKAYDYLACYYYGYAWSKELKQDCINYYQQHLPND